jgi:putative membrane protein
MTRTDAQTDILILTAAWVVGLILSGWSPHDRLTWLMEVMPALIALPLLWWYEPTLPFSRLVYALILVHGLILMLGGAYTYARVPPGAWVQDWLHLSRNPYDKLGHLAQGFVPAFVARELLIRRFKLKSAALVAFLAVCICLAVSALYEIIEWLSAAAMGGGATDFLGTQGDEWDTQEDMACAGIGALLALPFARLHDRSMAQRKAS